MELIMSIIIYPGTNASETFSDNPNTNSNDMLLGFGGNDHITAHGGNDLLDGGYGNDYMEGGAGSDIFRFREASASQPLERDTIGDFNTSQDTLQWIGQEGIYTEYTVAQKGNDTLITVNSQLDSGLVTHEILLLGVQSSDLSESNYDIHFV